MVTHLFQRIYHCLLRPHKSCKFAPPGHFYSPIPSLKEINLHEQLIWKKASDELPGIDMNIEEQKTYLRDFKLVYKDLPFVEEKNNHLRYFFNNPHYSYSDAIFLYCMLRTLKPKHIIEVGSGYSSCVMLDTNDIFFNNQIKISFIEPYPQLLQSVMKAPDIERYQVIPMGLQDVGIEKFGDLCENDILFIDSTHVSKINSDVNRIFFEILPMLSVGVYIHFHDIFYPFEYPRQWVFEGRAWNENYILRAFLQYNKSFKIVFFGSYLLNLLKKEFELDMPLCMKNIGGSIWIKKIS